MFTSSNSKSLRFLLAAAVILGSVACSSSGDKQASEQVSDDYEYVYVDENGNQVDPKSVSSDEYEVVDGEDVPASKELNDSVSDAEDAVASDESASDEEATDDELKEMLANINEGKDSLGNAPTPAEAEVAAPKSSKPAASKGSDEYVSLDDESTASDSAAPSSSGSQSGEAYTVVKGDTLSEIAQRLTGSFRTWPQLAEKNNIANPNLIYPGNKIFHDGITTASRGKVRPAPGPMPAGPTVEVQPGETLAAVAARVYGDAGKWRSLAKLNSSNIPDPNYIKVGQKVVYNEEMAANKPADATQPAEATTPAEQPQEAVAQPATDTATPTEETVSQPAEGATTEGAATTEQPTDSTEENTSH